MENFEKLAAVNELSKALPIRIAMKEFLNKANPNFEYIKNIRSPKAKNKTTKSPLFKGDKEIVNGFTSII